MFLYSQTVPFDKRKSNSNQISELSKVPSESLSQSWFLALKYSNKILICANISIYVSLGCAACHHSCFFVRAALKVLITARSRWNPWNRTWRSQERRKSWRISNPGLMSISSRRPNRWSPYRDPGNSSSSSASSKTHQFHI